MPPTRWLTRLSVQVTAVITLATAVGGGVSLWLVLRSQSRLLTDQTVQQAAFFSDTLLNSLERHMLRNERSELNAALTAVATQPQMTFLRLFDAGGRMAFSNHNGEIGRVADRNEPTCLACHQAGASHATIDPAARSRIIAYPTGRILATVTPVYNRPTCSSAECHAHPAGQRVLGVLEVAVSLEQVDATRANLQRTTATVSLCTIAGLAIVAIVFTRRQLAQPIAELASGVRRVKQGDLKEHVEVRGSGEIAELADDFNDMATVLLDERRQRLALLESLERQVEERTAALEKARATLIQTEKLSSLGRLSASIAHEINNPLAGILTYAKLLLRTLEKGNSDPAVHARADPPAEADRARDAALHRDRPRPARLRPRAPAHADRGGPERRHQGSPVRSSATSSGCRTSSSTRATATCRRSRPTPASCGRCC